MSDAKPDLLVALRHYGVDVQEHRVESVALCANPDHDETQPSMTVNSVKGLFSCKACGFQGDVYHLIAKREGTETFGATLRRAGELFGTAGVSVPSRGSRQGLLGKPGAAGRGYRPAIRRAGLRRG